MSSHPDDIFDLGRWLVQKNDGKWYSYAASHPEQPVPCSDDSIVVEFWKIMLEQKKNLHPPVEPQYRVGG